MQIRKIKKEIKKIVTRRNMIILACVIFMICLLCFFIFKPTEIKTASGIKVIETNMKENEEITEEKAGKVAVKQFKKLGEKSVKEDQVSIKKIAREGEEYYYITSKENTLEIQIKGGKITRVNSVLVEE